MLLYCGFSLHFLKTTLAIFSYTYPSFVHYFCDVSVEIFCPFASGLSMCVWLSNKRFCFCGLPTSLSLISDAFCIGFPLVSSFFILKQRHYTKEKVLSIFMRFDACLLVFLTACIFTKFNESPHRCKLTLSEILQSLQDCLHTALVS